MANPTISVLNPVNKKVFFAEELSKTNNVIPIEFSINTETVPITVFFKVQTKDLNTNKFEESSLLKVNLTSKNTKIKYDFSPISLDTSYDLKIIANTNADYFTDSTKSFLTTFTSQPTTFTVKKSQLSSAPIIGITSPTNGQVFDSKYFVDVQNYVSLDFYVTVKQAPVQFSYKIVLKNLNTNIIKEYSYIINLNSKTTKLNYTFDSSLPDGKYQVYVVGKTGELLGSTSNNVIFNISKFFLIQPKIIYVDPFFAGSSNEEPSLPKLDIKLPLIDLGTVFPSSKVDLPPLGPTTPFIQPSIPSSAAQKELPPGLGPVPVAPAAPIPPVPQFVPAPNQEPVAPPLPPPETKAEYKEETVSVEELKTKNLIIFEVPNIKPFLYQGGKNKVLFQIDKFFPILNKDYLNIQELKNKADKEKELYDLIESEFFNTTTAILYKTEILPKTLSDIANQSFIYKNLNISKNELGFEDTLEVNKDYYFLIEGKHKSESGKLKLLNYSDLKKVKIIKDEDLYFIEAQSVAKVTYLPSGNNTEIFTPFGPVKVPELLPTLLPYNVIDKNKTKKLLNKVFIDPIYSIGDIDLNNINKAIKDSTNNKLFNFNIPGFDSALNSKYIKLRVTSKKSRKKIDINLNYNFWPTIQSAKYIQELNNKEIKKLQYYVYVPAEEKAKAQEKDPKEAQKLVIFISELKDYIEKYNLKNNRNIQIIFASNDNTEIINLNGPLEWSKIIQEIILLKMFSPTIIFPDMTEKEMETMFKQVFKQSAR